MTFEYIIIGAGSAGCVLAARLSASGEHTVLLVEAGGKDSNPLIHIPAGYGKLHKSAMDYGFETQAQAALDGRKLYLPRGKVLGGSSSTNAMAYVRGHKEDYNDWAALGNKGWDYESVLPYFKKSETNADLENQYHGQGGELHVEYAKAFSTPFSEAFVNGCVEKGLAHNQDYNGAQQEGAGMFQFTIKNGKRHSGAAAFLKPALNRKNLTVMTHTQVQKIIIENDKAKGIEVKLKNGSSKIISAKYEVILSAGAFASPQLLMLSGIGDKYELQKQGIALKKELPGVGKNLQDHLFYAVSALSTVQKGQNHHIKPLNQVLDLSNYLLFKKGIFTTSPLEAVAFGDSTGAKGRTDFQFHFASLQIGNDYKADFYDMNTFPHNDGFSIMPTLLRPKSRGFVGINSSHAGDAPIIQPNFLTEDEDKQLLIKTGKLALEILQSKAFEPYLKEIITPPNGYSDEAFFEHIKKQVETVYHPVGTCKMGIDSMAVVDASLKVHGIEKLRVVDASIMPKIVSGNTNAPVYMIAEKAADMILKQN